MKKPKIKGVLVMCFEHDMDMQEITKIMQKEPSRSKRKSKCMINPLTKEKNPGYWELETEEMETYNSNEVQNLLYLLTHERVESIKYIISKYHCNVIYRFYVWIHKNEVPSLWFEQKLLNDINYLEAEIDIVISIY